MKHLNAVFFLPYLFCVVFWFVVLFVFCQMASAADHTYYAVKTVAETPGLPFNSFVLAVLGVAAWAGGK